MGELSGNLTVRRAALLEQIARLHCVVALGGVAVSVLATGPKVRGF
jgi:hypothetical protein